MQLEIMLSEVRWMQKGKYMILCRGPASAGSRGYPQDEQCRLEKTRETGLDRAKSARERERQRQRESDQWGVQQSLANLYFLL